MRITAEAPYKLFDIQNTIIEKSAGLLITGGEPTVKRHFAECAALLNELNYPVANVETNGHAIYELIGEVDPLKPVKFIFSPKIFNANDGHAAREIMSKIAGHQNVYVKLVYEPDNQYSMDYITFLQDEMEDLIANQRIWLMPKGVNRADLIRNAASVFDACEKYNFNFSSRSHIIFGFV
jgi:organic radical activating enzyme